MRAAVALQGRENEAFLETGFFGYARRGGIVADKMTLIDNSGTEASKGNSHREKFQFINKSDMPLLKINTRYVTDLTATTSVQDIGDLLYHRTSKR